MLIARLAVGAAATAVSLGAAGPSPRERIPREPSALADAFTRTTVAIRRAAGSWNGVSSPPAALTLPALYQQRIVRLLARETGLAERVIPRLRSDLRAHARDDVLARRELSRLTPPVDPRSIRIAKAEPAARLRRYYGEAQRRFGVRWFVLAAVNFVESDFGRIRSASAAGAQGPMQFMPATWRQYGLGGDVHDARDAILGAANLLRAAGARTNLARALYRYNPSRAYVDAVTRYARWMRSDPLAFPIYYNWQLFVKTTAGERRLTGPGVP